MIKRTKSEFIIHFNCNHTNRKDEFDYPEFHLSMDCFWYDIVKSDFVLKEHEDARWLTREQLDNVEWLPADITLIEKIRKAI